MTMNDPRGATGLCVQNSEVGHPLFHHSTGNYKIYDLLHFRKGKFEVGRSLLSYITTTLIVTI